MSMVDARHVEAAPKSERRNRRPFVYGSVITFVFVAALTTMTMRDGASGAVETALLGFAIAATAVGVWGTAMAVRETDELRTRPED
jgi:hypothetical protein